MTALSRFTLVWGLPPFLNSPPKAKETKAKINNWDLVKLKSFGTAKQTTDKIKR